MNPQPSYPTSSEQGPLLNVGSPLCLNFSRKPSAAPAKSLKVGKKQGRCGRGSRWVGLN